MSTSLSDIVKVSRDEKPCVDFKSTLDDYQVVAGYVPVKSTLDLFNFMKTACANQSPTGRAVICYGSYGTGKSRLCAVLARLLRDGFDCPALLPVWERFTQRNALNKIDELKQILVPAGTNWRPWLIVPMFSSGGGSTISIALIKSLLQSVKDAQLEDKVLGKTIYHAASRRLDEIIGNGASYEDNIADSIYITPEQLKRALEKDFDENALNVFKAFHKKVTHGVDFVEYVRASGETVMEAYEVYNAIASEIQSKGYAGIAIIWDEFGYAIEQLLRDNQTGVRNLREEAMSLQEFLEKSCGANDLDKRIVFLGFTHVTLSEYGTREGLNETDTNRLDTVADRFRSPSINIRLNVTEAEGYHILAGMTRRTDEGKSIFSNCFSKLQRIADMMPKHAPWNRVTPQLCYDEIVSPCYPMHPSASISLILLSDQIAQVNRTTFYFLQNRGEGGLAEYLECTSIKDSSDIGGNELLRVNNLFSFFEQAISESNGSFYEQYKESLVLCPNATKLEKNILQCILILLVIANPDISPTTSFLCFCMGDAELDDAKAGSVLDALTSLSKANVIWKNEATDVWSFVSGQGINTELEDKLKDEKSVILKYPAAEMIQKNPQVQNEITDVLGDFDLYPSKSGIVRRIGVRVLDLAKGDEAIEEVNPAYDRSSVCWRAALVYLVVTDTATQLDYWRNRVQLLKKPNIYFVLPSQPINIDSDKIRDLISVQNVLSKTSPDTQAYRILEGKLLKLRKDLRLHFEKSFGNTGLRAGTIVLGSGETKTTVNVSSWNELLPSISARVESYFKNTINVKCGTYNEWITGKVGGVIKNITERILDMEQNPQWQKEYLGYSVSKQEAAIIDGVLVENDLLTQNALNQQWCLKEIDSNCLVSALAEIHNHFTSGGMKPKEFHPLYAKLVSLPYGIPNGIIPILIALVLRKERQRIVILSKTTSGQPKKISDTDMASTIVKMTNSPKKYSTRYDKLTGKFRLVYKAVGPEMGKVFTTNKNYGNAFNEYCEDVRSLLVKWMASIPEDINPLPEMTENQRKLFKLLRNAVPPHISTLAEHLVNVIAEDDDAQTELTETIHNNSYPRIAKFWKSFRDKVDRHIDGIKAPLRNKVKDIAGPDCSGITGISNGLIKALEDVESLVVEGNPFQKVIQKVQNTEPGTDPIDSIASAISDKSPQNLTEEDYGRAIGILDVAQYLKKTDGRYVIILPSGEKRFLTDKISDDVESIVFDDIKNWRMTFKVSNDELAYTVIRAIYSDSKDGQ